MAYQWLEKCRGKFRKIHDKFGGNTGIIVGKPRKFRKIQKNPGKSEKTQENPTFFVEKSGLIVKKVTQAEQHAAIFNIGYNFWS